jgi:PhoH-like ATPase
MGLLEIEPLTYIRGRSIPKQYMIVDEAQNLTPHEIKTIITRAGEGTKIVLTGDPYQIDNPYVDSSSNGLTYTVEKIKGQDIAAHVTLTKGERSPLAELAANLL